jgi:translation initiation factor 2B subunit (eIF-2B alpha/beta/delta family)
VIKEDEKASERIKEEKKSCPNEACLKLNDVIQRLKDDHQNEKEAYIKEIKSLRGIIAEIRDIFKFSARGDISNLPSLIREFKSSLNFECERSNEQI